MENSEQPVQTDSPVQQSIENRIAAKFGADDSAPDEVPEQSQAQEDAPEQSETEGQPKVDDSAEVEVDGATYRVPKELKDAVLRHADYTRKTQEVAERARALDAQARMLQEQAAFQAEASRDFSRLQQIEQALEAYQKVDFTQLGTEDLLKMRIQVDQLKDEREKAAQALNAKQQQFFATRGATIAQLQEHGAKVLKQAIPNWGADAQKALAEYAVNEGYRHDELANVLDPRMIKTLWKAQQWDTLQAQKPGATKRANEAPPVVKPGSSAPEMNQRMDRVRFAKDIKNAKTPQDKAKLIQSRLERMF